MASATFESRTSQQIYLNAVVSCEKALPWLSLSPCMTLVEISLIKLTPIRFIWTRSEVSVKAGRPLQTLPSLSLKKLIRLWLVLWFLLRILTRSKLLTSFLEQTYLSVKYASFFSFLGEFLVINLHTIPLTIGPTKIVDILYLTQNQTNKPKTKTWRCYKQPWQVRRLISMTASLLSSSGWH